MKPEPTGCSTVHDVQSRNHYGRTASVSSDSALTLWLRQTAGTLLRAPSRQRLGPKITPQADPPGGLVIVQVFRLCKWYLLSYSRPPLRQIILIARRRDLAVLARGGRGGLDVNHRASAALLGR